MAANPYSAPKSKVKTGVSMDEGSFVRNIGLALLAIIAVNATLLCLMTPSMIMPIVKAVIQAIIVIFMISGANWARWMLVVGCGFGAIFGLYVFFTLNKHNISQFSFIGIWIFLMVIFDGIISTFLLFSQRVNKYFGT